MLTKLKKPNDLKNTIDEYKDINLNCADDLINKIGYNVTAGDNIIDLDESESIYFKDLLDFLFDTENLKINKFNKMRA